MEGFKNLRVELSNAIMRAAEQSIMNDDDDDDNKTHGCRACAK